MALLDYEMSDAGTFKDDSDVIGQKWELDPQSMTSKCRAMN